VRDRARDREVALKKKVDRVASRSLTRAGVVFIKVWC
jgi:hypothetical protein